MDLKPKQDFDGKWGFVDSDGVWQITPLYDSVEQFEGEYAKARVGDQHMFIDKDGRWFKELPKGERPEFEDTFLDHPEYKSPLDILMDGFSKATDVIHKGLKDCE